MNRNVEDAKRLYRATVFVLVVWTSLPASAWDRDVHYDLTRWLAFQAGFTAPKAGEIATADQLCDDSSHSAAVQSMAWTYLLNDRGSARDVQKKHFISSAKIPSSPVERRVTPDNAAAKRLMKFTTEVTDASDALQDLGEALHAFEDTWSHAGVPDVPTIGLRGTGVQTSINPNLAYGHPVTRGGWRKHDADLTHIVVQTSDGTIAAQDHPSEIVTMSGRVYEYLQTFLTNNPAYRHHSAARWSDLGTDVLKFAQANTKDAKSVWIATHRLVVPPPMVSSEDDDTEDLTLPGRSTNPLKVSAVPNPTSSCFLPPPELIAQASKFTNEWFTGKIVAANERIDLEALGAELTDSGIQGTENVRTWSRRFMTMYLLNDHGTVNARGHCDPTHSRYAELPEMPPPGDTRAHIDPPEVSCASLASLGDDSLFGMVLSFDALPRDAVILVWRRTSPTTWRVFRMVGVVE